MGRAPIFNSYYGIPKASLFEDIAMLNIIGFKLLIHSDGHRSLNKVMPDPCKVAPTVYCPIRHFLFLSIKVCRSAFLSFIRCVDRHILSFPGVLMPVAVFFVSFLHFNLTSEFDGPLLLAHAVGGQAGVVRKVLNAHLLDVEGVPVSLRVGAVARAVVVQEHGVLIPDHAGGWVSVDQAGQPGGPALATGNHGLVDYDVRLVCGMSRNIRHR